MFAQPRLLHGNGGARANSSRFCRLSRSCPVCPWMRHVTSRKEHGMNAFTKSSSILSIAAAALFMGPTSQANASDVYFSVGGSGTSCVSYSSYKAGVLYIDGYRYTIRSSSDIGSQIVRAFKRRGYDASCVNGKVVVCYDPYCPPRVSWSRNGYSLSQCASHGRLELSWCRIGSSGHGWSYGWDSHRSNSGWGHDRHRDRGWDRGRDRGRGHSGSHWTKPRKRPSRRRCD